MNSTFAGNAFGVLKIALMKVRVLSAA